MSALVCRVCLNGNVRMLRIQDEVMLEIYEKLTGCVLNTHDDGWPNSVCYICVSQLQRCRRFTDMARESTRTLTYLLHNGIEVTNSNMTALNLGASHHLAVVDVDDSTTITINESFEVKLNQEQANVKEETPEEEWLEIDILDSDVDSVGSQSTELPVAFHTGETPYYYACDTCNKAFAQYGDYKRHMLVHTRKRPHACFTCNKTFTQKKHLKSHTRVHTVDHLAAEVQLARDNLSSDKDNKYLYCDQCNKKCVSRSDLIIHLRIHTGEKPYACKKCFKAFPQMCHLNRHMLIHTGEKPYACDRCFMVFRQAGNLKSHMRAHTGEKPYVCNVCNKAYRGSYILKQHMLIHTGEMPHTCNICDKAFRQARHLKRHMQVHTNRDKIHNRLLDKHVP